MAKVPGVGVSPAVWVSDQLSKSKKRIWMICSSGFCMRTKSSVFGSAGAVEIWPEKQMYSEVSKPIQLGGEWGEDLIIYKASASHHVGFTSVNSRGKVLKVDLVLQRGFIIWGATTRECQRRGVHAKNKFLLNNSVHCSYSAIIKYGKCVGLIGSMIRDLYILV